MMRNERHLGDCSRNHPATNVDQDGGTDLGELGLNKAHSNVLADGGAGAAALDCADLATILVVDSSTLTRRSTTRDETNTLNGSTLTDLTKDSVSADEATLTTTTLGNSPVEGRFNERDVLVEIMTVEGETSLQTESIASTETSEADIAKLAHTINKFRSKLDGHGNLETILTSVATAGDEAVGNTAKSVTLTSHELLSAQTVMVLRTNHLGNSLLSLWTLEGNESVSGVERLKLDTRELTAKSRKMSHILVEASSVDDEVKVVGKTTNNGIIDGATTLVGDDCVADCAVGSVLNVNDSGALNETLTVRTVDANLTHVRHIKDGSVLAGLLDLAHHTSLLVLNRHLPSTEIDELGTSALVKFIEGGPLQGLC